MKSLAVIAFLSAVSVSPASAEIDRTCDAVTMNILTDAIEKIEGEELKVLTSIALENQKLVAKAKAKSLSSKDGKYVKPPEVFWSKRTEAYANAEFELGNTIILQYCIGGFEFYKTMSRFEKVDGRLNILYGKHMKANPNYVVDRTNNTFKISYDGVRNIVKLDDATPEQYAQFLRDRKSILAISKAMHILMADTLNKYKDEKGMGELAHNIRELYDLYINDVMRVPTKYTLKNARMVEKYKEVDIKYNTTILQRFYASIIAEKQHKKLNARNSNHDNE